jgi:hypothetical protein
MGTISARSTARNYAGCLVRQPHVLRAGGSERRRHEEPATSAVPTLLGRVTEVGPRWKTPPATFAHLALDRLTSARHMPRTLAERTVLLDGPAARSGPQNAQRCDAGEPQHETPALARAALRGGRRGVRPVARKGHGQGCAAAAGVRFHERTVWEVSETLPKVRDRRPVPVIGEGDHERPEALRAPHAATPGAACWTPSPVRCRSSASSREVPSRWLCSMTSSTVPGTSACQNVTGSVCPIRSRRSRACT